MLDSYSRKLILAKKAHGWGQNDRPGRRNEDEKCLGGVVGGGLRTASAEAGAIHLGSRLGGLVRSSDWDWCLDATACGVQEADGPEDRCIQTGVCGAPGEGKSIQSCKLSEEREAWD